MVVFNSLIYKDIATTLLKEMLRSSRMWELRHRQKS